MMIQRLLPALLGAVSCCAGTAQAAGAVYPDHPLRLILPFPTGGPTDIVARAFGQKLGEAPGQHVVIDNRGGAAGVIACDIAAHAVSDGYTLLLGTIGTRAVQPNLTAKLPYQPLRDFAPVSLLSASPYVFALSNTVQARSVKELVALAKASPGKFAYASGGVGTGNHLSAELFRITAGVDLVHVPYKGSSLAITDVISGQVQIWFLNLLPATPYVKANRIRALAVTSAKRAHSAPDIPTVAESGYPSYETTSWHGILVPVKTPAAIVTRLNAELVKIARQPELRDLLGAQGSEVIGSTPEEFTAKIKVESAKWANVIKTANIRAE
ncbi:MAG: tripartite tricarboxylate transporter substrate binding protein [Betaproteobacteria bacterium]